MADTGLIEPTVDTNKRVLTYRNVQGVCDGSSKTVISVRDTPGLTTDEPLERGGTNQGATPVETLMGSLCGCDAAITHLVSKLLKFEYGQVEYTADAQIDTRGVQGVQGVRPYFEKVTVKKVMATNEPPERIEKLRKNVEQRCPVSNLIRDAGVDLTFEWEIVPLN